MSLKVNDLVGFEHVSASHVNFTVGEVDGFWDDADFVNISSSNKMYPGTPISRVKFIIYSNIEYAKDAKIAYKTPIYDGVGIITQIQAGFFGSDYLIKNDYSGELSWVEADNVYGECFKLENEVINKDGVHACNCDLNVVINRGCQCGGI